MYFSRTISHACVVRLLRRFSLLHQLHAQRGHFVLRLFLRLQQHLVQPSLRSSSRTIFGTMFAPVFLGHPAVLCQWCHLSAFGLKKGQAARPNSNCFAGLP